MGTLLAFLSYALGFFARPIGGLVFGHFGDRIGRKPLLIISLVLMGGATFAIGLLPTYAAIGVWSAIALSALRLIQGFALGGEWGAERCSWSPSGCRPDDAARGPACPRPESHWATSSPPESSPCSPPHSMTTPSSTGGDGVSPSCCPPCFWSWATGSGPRSRTHRCSWRHTNRQRRRWRRKPPARTVLREHRRELAACASARLTENIVYYVLTAFILVYAVERSGVDKSVVLNALVLANVIQLVATPFFGALSDKLGRRPVLLGGAIGTAVWIWIFFWLLDTGSSPLVFLAMVGGSSSTRPSTGLRQRSSPSSSPPGSDTRACRSVPRSRP